jgi:hypothetical protein
MGRGNPRAGYQLTDGRFRRVVHGGPYDSL